GRFLMYAGIIFFGFSILINLITLPAEYNASHRAINMLDEFGVLGQNELVGAKKVLSSAALTYVAALFVSILNLLRFLLAFRRRD
ncbi:MAG: zinc metallopeptidase, partial [Clostridia bacterium]|nr:zinc metallopeptidase [Clostridia bacterium]